MQTRSQTRKMATKLSADDTEQFNCSEQSQKQEVTAIQEQIQKSGEYNDSAKDISQQEYEGAINEGCKDDGDDSKNEEQNNCSEQAQEQEITAVQEQIQKPDEYNNSAKDTIITDGCEDDREYGKNKEQISCSPEQQEITTVEEHKEQRPDEYNDSAKDIRQQEYERTMDDGCENDKDSSEDEESLLKKAEKSLQTIQSNQSTKNGNKMRNEFSFPSLNVGISIDEQLYIKRHPGGTVTLRQDEIIQDNSSKKHKTSMSSLSNVAPAADDNDQDSYVKLSRKEKQKLRESTTGPGWFDMKKPEITPEIKRDLQIIKLRNVLDPKRFYKKDDSKGLPKYFEIGTIKEGPTEFYSSRIPRKERRQTIADELLANEQSKSYFKRKFDEIQEAKQSGGKKYYKQLKAKRKPNWEKSL